MKLHDEIFFATCLAMSEQEIHCKLHETYHMLQPQAVTNNGINNMLQSKAASCNGFKKSPQSLQKVRPSSAASATQCNFLCNLCCNGIARQVAECNMPSLQLVSQLFWACNDCSE